MKYPMYPRRYAIKQQIDLHTLGALRAGEQRDRYIEMTIQEMERAMGEAVIRECGVKRRYNRHDTPSSVLEIELIVEAVPADELGRFTARAETMHSKHWFAKFLSDVADTLWGWALYWDRRERFK